MQLLIVGSLDGYMSEAGQIAHARGAKVTHATDIEQALHMLRSGQGADLLMVDVRHPIAGLMAQLKSERIVVPVVACGIGNDSAAAVRAIKAGAKEYVPLPPNKELIAAIFEAVTGEDSHFIHADPAMERVMRMADQIAPSDASVLILGESGTGKEVLARYLHQHSRRAKGRMISVNCAAIPENLLESELFGHEKGAFTGAVARRIGKFEEASGGTLLLDEISEMDPRLQAKLLRALQEREIDRLGGSKPVKVDLRVLATSNRDLAVSVQNGQFRGDLYYRLNVVALTLPPLRQRPADIVPLAQHFIAKYSALNDVPIRRLDAAATAKLQQYSWPGNVRELENIIHRAVLLAPPTVIDAGAIDFPQASPLGGAARSGGVNVAVAAAAEANAGSTSPGSGLPVHPGLPGQATPGVGTTMAEMEKNLILSTLDHCLGNRTQAATILGISIRTLRNKLNQYGHDLDKMGAG
ncbi:MAG: sigma-54 dependent transcriptional regulator [Candidatus Symbiobacter sp.]|nr:sigma-54 dependent transcriptional regulator [Candidatus Symbiobacter sp.]